MTQQTARGREGYGFIEITSYEPKNAEAPRIWTPTEQEPMYWDVAKRVAHLEGLLREGRATIEDLECLENLRGEAR